MKFQKADCYCLFGKRKSGKSYLARKINEAYPRQVIVDPVADWTDGEVVNSFEQFTDLILKRKDDPAFKIIFRFHPDQEFTAEIFNEVLRICYHAGDLQVIVDEIQMFCSPQWMPPYLKHIAFTGRHHGVGFCVITQRPSQINKGLLSQSEHVFCGQLHDRNDLAAVASFIGEDLETLVTLPERNFIYFSPTFGKKKFSTENNK